MTIDRPAVHLTLKWPARPDLGAPEIMVNLYGASAEELAPNLAEIGTLAAAFMVGAIPQVNTAPAPAPAAPRPEPHEDYWPACPNADCSRQGDDMLASQYGGHFCPGHDPGEADGRCRWVHDNKGLRRKPTKAEVDAERAANRGARPARDANGYRRQPAGRFE